MTRTTSFLFVLAASLCVAGAALAGIPEPDAIYFGSVQVDGAPAANGTLISIREGSDGAGELLDEFTLGGVPSAGDLYVLRIPLEASEGGALSGGSAQVGDQGIVFVNGIAAGLVSIGSRGRVVRMDIAASSTTPPDVDGDGAFDFVDNCGGVPNAGQADSNGNGIGDICEPFVNPGLSFVSVENVDNPADPSTGKGSVSYAFEIGNTEVSNIDYVEFLNAVAAADPGALYSELMASDPRGGILREGASGSYSYKVKPNLGDKPVNFVSWLDAARYANWLENQQPSGPQDATTTEDGAFDLTVENPGENAVLRETAMTSLPTESEWYKAAYYDPSVGQDFYWLYPTREDDPGPAPVVSNPIGYVTNIGPGVANFADAAVWNGQTGNVIAVASTGAQSFYGTLEQGGNVSEWLAAAPEQAQRVARGGSWTDDRFAMESISDSPDRAAVLRDPLLENSELGFRIVKFEARILDEDGDGVSDDRDNCVGVFNPALGSQGRPARASFQTTTGGQLDDDADGFGNECDAKFTESGQFVSGVDLSEMNASFNKARDGNDCGSTGDKPCSIFDLDNSGQVIGGTDLSRALALFNGEPGPSCAGCPLQCVGPNCGAVADSDGDGVPDDQDNCIAVFNPALGTLGAPARQSFQTTTGGQLDDDADGVGNECDAKFASGGQVVGGLDLGEMNASFNKNRSASNCGATGDKPCAPFDLDNLGQFIGGNDLTRARELFNQVPGPACNDCPLACEGPACS